MSLCRNCHYSAADNTLYCFTGNLSRNDEIEKIKNTLETGKCKDFISLDLSYQERKEIVISRRLE